MTKQKQRADLPAEFKWRPCDLVASDAIWETEMAAMPAKIEGFARFRGKLSPENLADCLAERTETDAAFTKLYVYANLKLHEDTTDPKYQDFADRAAQTHVALMAAEAFVEPEILAMKVAALDAVPELALYRHYLDDLFRQKPHIRDAETEQLLAQVHELGAAPDTIFEMLNNADLKFGEVTDEDGRRVELTHGRYGALIESPDRAVRSEAWHTYYDSYHALKNTLAAAYAASVKKDVFFARARGHSSALSAALFGNNIPETVYSGLLEAVHEALPQLHRYLRLRRKALRLDALHVYDLYTPLVKVADDKVPYADAVRRVLDAMAPLGADYVEAARAGLAPGGGWVDVYENAGKATGAYAWGAHGGHPYILLNYENKLGDMFTLAHELGHAMHSFYSWGAQPPLYSDYTIFVAEVASTVNEALLMEHLRARSDDPATQAYLVNFFLDQFRTTVFRQTMFAEFEMLTHRKAEAGESLTVESLNTLYRELNARYYGDALVIDDKLDLEWARIPHFYRSFYVYQYATGFAAAMAFADKILHGDGTADYLAFLAGGASDYSTALLARAGVDPTSPEPVRAAMRKFTELLDTMETLLENPAGAL